MGKLLYSVTMSADGFVAGPGADMSWLTEHPGPNATVDELIGRIGALLVGNRAFRGDDPYPHLPWRRSIQGRRSQGGQARSAAGGSDRSLCLTHHAPDTPVPGVTFLSDLETGVEAAKVAAGDLYVNVLGAQTAQQCVDTGVLDEILVCIALFCSVTASGSSTDRAGRTSGSNASVGPPHRKRRTCGCASSDEAGVCPPISEG